MQDPRTTWTPAGLQIFIVLMVAIWFLLGCWYTYSIIQSLKDSSGDKTTLFRNLAIVYCPWFFALPATYIVTAIVAPWVSDRIAVCLCLFWFPFLSDYVL